MTSGNLLFVGKNCVISIYFDQLAGFVVLLVVQCCKGSHPRSVIISVMHSGVLL